MGEEVEKKLKDFYEVFDVIDNMIKHIDEMFEKLNVPNEAPMIDSNDALPEHQDEPESGEK